MNTTGTLKLEELWRSVSRGRTPASALPALYVELGRRASPDMARALSRQALDLAPGSFDALCLFERYALPTDREELCARYESFLAHSPFHGQSPRIRENLIDLLVELGHYDAALVHVRVLTRLSTLKPGSDAIARACSVPPPGVELPGSVEELDEFDLECASPEELSIDIEVERIFAEAAE